MRSARDAVAGLSEAPIVVGAPSAPVRIDALWEELVAAGTSVERRTKAAPAYIRGDAYWVRQSGTVAIRRSEGQIGLKFPRGCLPVYYIDGVPREIVMPMWTGVVPPDLGPNQFVVLGEIEAIEVYKGLGSIPGEFKKLDAGCGVIVIWTRHGLDGREQPARPR